MTSLFITQCSEPLSVFLRHYLSIRAINLIVLPLSPPLTFSDIVYGKLCNIVTYCLSVTEQCLLLWSEQ